MRHYEQKLFVCDHPACVGQAFSVFNTRLELMEHKKLVHRERETLNVVLLFLLLLLVVVFSV